MPDRVLRVVEERVVELPLGGPNPMALVYQLVMQHVEGVDAQDRRVVDGDMRCCRPFKPERAEDEPIPTAAEPGVFVKRRRGRNSGRALQQLMNP